MSEEINDKIQEAYEEFKDMLNDNKSFPMLNAMCENCEQWCGNNHDYKMCRDKPCFINALGYIYLEWEGADDETI